MGGSRAAANGSALIKLMVSRSRYQWRVIGTAIVPIRRTKWYDTERIRSYVIGFYYFDFSRNGSDTQLLLNHGGNLLLNFLPVC